MDRTGNGSDKTRLSSYQKEPLGKQGPQRQQFEIVDKQILRENSLKSCVSGELIHEEADVVGLVSLRSGLRYPLQYVKLAQNGIAITQNVGWAVVLDRPTFSHGG